jgi:hypothetical protein
MQKKSISRILLQVTPVMIVFGLLSASSPAWADGGDIKCENRTLLGDYGFAIEGLILTNPGAPLPPGAWLPVRGVAMTNFDGKGNLSQVDHVLVSGIPPAVEWTAGSGTYSVNPDCTGTAVINVPGNPFAPVKLHFVVVKQGKEIHTVVEANAVTSVGIKIE